MIYFNFESEQAQEALVIVSHNLDFLLDYLDQPWLLALPMPQQMALITEQIAKSESMELGHAYCTIALCLIRLLEDRHANTTPEGRPDT